MLGFGKKKERPDKPVKEKKQRRKKADVPASIISTPSPLPPSTLPPKEEDVVFTFRPRVNRRKKDLTPEEVLKIFEKQGGS